jgi:hypothetical protein
MVIYPKRSFLRCFGFDHYPKNGSDFRDIPVLSGWLLACRSNVALKSPGHRPDVVEWGNFVSVSPEQRNNEVCAGCEAILVRRGLPVA